MKERMIIAVVIFILMSTTVTIGMWQWQQIKKLTKEVTTLRAKVDLIESLLFIEGPEPHHELDYNLEDRKVFGGITTWKHITEGEKNRIRKF